jgi:hypothetical protein
MSHVMPGKIVSGSGDTYQVELWPDGLKQKSEIKEVKQLQISPNETIPIGTKMLVVKMNADEYFMQVPVYGPKASAAWSD